MYVQSLDGAWELREWQSDQVYKAQVPGCVHLDLMKAGAIEDPFVGDNEYRSAWVHETDWEYLRSFEADPELFAADRIYLECDGLDTLADLTLNGHILGHAENMYIQHRFDVTDKLIPCDGPHPGGNGAGLSGRGDA
jgi:beta-mannosidase